MSDDSSKHTFVSLGSNCAITYWLNVFKLRHCAYPFDWTNIDIIKLIDVLSNDFYEYDTTLYIKRLSDKHFNQETKTETEIETKSTYLITNKYNITFAHEVLNASDIDNFKKSILNRIERFRLLSCTKFITFIRIELSPIKKTYWTHIDKLIELLDKINKHYSLIIIIHKDSIIPSVSHSSIKIFFFDSFSPDWKMPSINWKLILTNPTFL